MTELQTLATEIRPDMTYITETMCKTQQKIGWEPNSKHFSTFSELYGIGITVLFLFSHKSVPVRRRSDLELFQKVGNSGNTTVAMVYRSSNADMKENETLCNL